MSTKRTTEANGTPRFEVKQVAREWLVHDKNACHFANGIHDAPINYVFAKTTATFAPNYPYDQYQADRLAELLNGYTSQHDTLVEQVRRLREYAQHTPLCTTRCKCSSEQHQKTHGECDCGFWQVLRETEAKK